MAHVTSEIFYFNRVFEGSGDSSVDKLFPALALTLEFRPPEPVFCYHMLERQRQENPWSSLVI